MEKTGRNDPCPCGSGKKYKKCCLPKHEAEERLRAAGQQAEREERAAAHRLSLREARARMLAGVEDDIDQLTAASNAAAALVRAAKLDEAERAAQDLLERFPGISICGAILTTFGTTGCWPRSQSESTTMT